MLASIDSKFYNRSYQTYLYSHGDKTKETTYTMETDFFRRLIDLHNSHDYPLSRAAVFLTNVCSPTSISQNRFPDKGPAIPRRDRVEKIAGKIYNERTFVSQARLLSAFWIIRREFAFLQKYKKEKRKGESEIKKEERKDEPSLNGQWHLRGWRNNPRVSPHLHEIPDTAPALLFLFSSLDLVFALAVQRFARIHFPGTLINSLAE